jgi:hypothetical protein
MSAALFRESLGRKRKKGQSRVEIAEEPNEAIMEAFWWTN